MANVKSDDGSPEPFRGLITFVSAHYMMEIGRLWRKGDTIIYQDLPLGMLTFSYFGVSDVNAKGTCLIPYLWVIRGASGGRKGAYGVGLK